MFLRGCGSNLTQEPSPHLLARPLRQALYWRLDCGPVLERLATWDPNTGPTFIQEVIKPDNTLDHLLYKPGEAFQQIFGDCLKNPEISQGEWRNHVFSQKSVIAELCAWTSSSRGYLDILAEL